MIQAIKDKKYFWARFDQLTREQLKALKGSEWMERYKAMMRLVDEAGQDKVFLFLYQYSPYELRLVSSTTKPTKALTHDILVNALAA